MAESEPIAEKLSSPSGAPLTALTWADVRTRLTNSGDYLLATSGADGRVHMVPVLGVWLEGAVCFVTRRQTRKARELAENDNCAITVPVTTSTSWSKERRTSCATLPGCNESRTCSRPSIRGGTHSSGRESSTIQPTSP
jgi:Pyridoxamine 5'-phosphate oxidase